MDSNKTFPVSKSIEQNLEYIKNVFNPDKNFDFVIREFDINIATKPTKAFLIFFDGLANKEFINRDILNPLMTADTEAKATQTEDIIFRRLLTQAPNSKITEMETEKRTAYEVSVSKLECVID